MMLHRGNVLTGLLIILLTLMGITIAENKDKKKEIAGAQISKILCYHNSDLHINVTKRNEGGGVGYYLYKIKTKNKKTFEELSVKEYIIIHGKCPKECVNVSVKYVVHQNRTVKRESKWSPEVTFCSAHKINSHEIKIKNKPLKMVPAEVLKPPEVTRVKIMNKQIIISVNTNTSSFSPTLMSAFYLAKVFEDDKIIKSNANFRGTFHFRNVNSKTCLNISFQIAVISKSNPNFVVYSTLSSPKVYCIKGDKLHADERSMLSTLLSCLIPSITILTLIIGAFISYYRKKQLEEDLNSSDASLAEQQLLEDTESPVLGQTNKKLQRSGTSSGNTTPPPPLPSSVPVVTDDRPQKEKKKGKMDEKLYTTNKQELSRFLSDAGSVKF